MMFERVIEKLLPTGRAWLQRPVKIMGAIFGGIADEMALTRLVALKVKDSIFPQLMDVEFIPDWENRFNLFDANLTEQERRDRLDAQWQSRNIASEYLETQLQDNGFDVFVKESAILANPTSLGDDILGDFVLEGNIVAGQIVTQCTSNVRPDSILGEFTLDTSTDLSHPVKADPCKDLAGAGVSLGDFVLGDDIALEANKAKFIVNHIDASLDPIASCPVLEQRCIFIFYIQGPGEFGDVADVPAARYNEFRELVLKHKRASAWAACFINLI